MVYYVKKATQERTEHITMKTKQFALTVFKDYFSCIQGKILIKKPRYHVGMFRLAYGLINKQMILKDKCKLEELNFSEVTENQDTSYDSYYINLLIKGLESEGVLLLQSNEMVDVYRYLNAYDKFDLPLGFADLHKKLLVQWHEKPVNIGKYIIRENDCYDARTKALYASWLILTTDAYQDGEITNTELIEQGWFTRMRIQNFGYEWFAQFKKSGIDKMENMVQDGDIIFTQQCSPLSGTGDHYGIYLNYKGKGVVFHRAGPNHDIIGDPKDSSIEGNIEFFTRNVNGDKLVHILRADWSA